MEALQKMSDAPLKDCPACEKSELTKLVSAASFRLKGGGWYETDFKTDGKKQLAESDSAAKDSKPAKSAGTSDAAKTDKKPAAKASSDSKSDKGSKPKK